MVIIVPSACLALFVPGLSRAIPVALVLLMSRLDHCFVIISHALEAVIAFRFKKTLSLTFL